MRAPEVRWRSLTENAPNITIIVDRDGIIRFINHTVSGLQVKKSIGTSHYDYTRPEYHEVMKESVE